MLQTLPDTPVRAQHELHMQTHPWSGVDGHQGVWGPGSGAPYTRARELCHQVGDTPQLCRVLGGLAGFYQQRAEFQRARELGEQHLILAQGLQDPRSSWRPTGVGIRLYFLGELTAAQAHLEQAIALSLPSQTAP